MHVYTSFNDKVIKKKNKKKIQRENYRLYAKQESRGVFV